LVFFITKPWAFLARVFSGQRTFRLSFGQSISPYRLKGCESTKCVD
jgi:hypothetical protein